MIWQLNGNLGIIMECIQRDLLNTENELKSKLALALLLGFTFNLRNGSSNDVEDLLGVFTLTSENFFIWPDNVIILAFIGKSGTISNKKHSFKQPKIYDFIISQIGDDKIIFPRPLLNVYLEEIMPYFRQISNVHKACFKSIKPLNTSIQLKNFLIILNQQPLCGH